MTAATPSLEHLSVDHLKPSAQNPRRIDDKHPSLPGLAESLKAQGMLEPILVRPIAGHWFEILAGERRWRAARIAGMTEVPCLVREVDDAKAFEITVTENLQREDLHWLEEARGVQMMATAGWMVDVIAKQIGKSPAWVAVRTKLATLSPAFLKACENPNSDMHALPIAKLELIARMPHEVQLDLLKRPWCVQRGDVADLREELDGRMHLLKAAPWDLTDAKLVPKAGACSSCPTRSSCQANLFEEVKGDTCLNQTCWEQKHAVHSKLQLAALRKETPKAVLVSTEHYGAPKGTLPARDYEIAKPTAKGAVPAIVVDEDGKAPRLVHIVKGAHRSGSSGKVHHEKTGPKPAKVRLAEFMKRRRRAEVGIMLGKLGAPPDATSVNHWGQPKACAEGVVRPTRAQLVALATIHGIRSAADGSWGAGGMAASAWTKVSHNCQLTDEQLDDVLWLKVRRTLISQLIADKCFRAEAGGAKFMAKICSVDWNHIVHQVRDKMPIPKSLADKFDENGMPVGKALASKPAKREKYNPDKILADQAKATKAKQARA